MCVCSWNNKGLWCKENKHVLQITMLILILAILVTQKRKTMMTISCVKKCSGKTSIDETYIGRVTGVIVLLLGLGCVRREVFCLSRLNYNILLHISVCQLWHYKCEWNMHIIKLILVLKDFMPHEASFLSYISTTDPLWESVGQQEAENCRGSHYLDHCRRSPPYRWFPPTQGRLSSWLIIWPATTFGESC